jgi:IclR family KDG regulon transcriptional repressor
MADSPVSGANHTKAVGRALDILECFRDAQTSLSLMEISRSVDAHESTLFRILLTLEGRGYLYRNDDGTFKLAPKLGLGRLCEYSEKIRELVHPFLEQLSHAFNETTSLKFLFESRIEVIDFVAAVREIGQTMTIGKLVAPHCTSTGKVITAFQPKEVIANLLQCYGLDRRTENTITDVRLLKEEFERVRQNGYAVDREESNYGGSWFGAPLFNDRQRVIAAISIFSPLVRLNAQREAEMIEAVIDTAGRASMAIQSNASAPGTRDKELPRVVPLAEEVIDATG